MKNLKTLKAITDQDVLEACKRGFPKAFENETPLELYDVIRDGLEEYGYVWLFCPISTYYISLDIETTPLLEVENLNTEKNMKCDQDAVNSFLKLKGYEFTDAK